MVIVLKVETKPQTPQLYVFKLGKKPNKCCGRYVLFSHPLMYHKLIKGGDRLIYYIGNVKYIFSAHNPLSF